MCRPSRLGGQDQYSFSPDGKEVAYTSNLDEVEATSTNNDIFLVPVAGGAPKKITTNPGSDSTPIYSPDGKYIAYRSQLRAGYESDRFRLMLYERATGKITDLTPNFDRWVDFDRVGAGFEEHLLHRGERRRESDLQARCDDRPVRGRWKWSVDSTTAPTPTADGKMLVFDRMSVEAPNEIYSAPLQFPQCADSQFRRMPTACLIACCRRLSR